MKVTFFLLLVAAVAFLAVFQPAVEAAPQDVAAAVETQAPAETGPESKPEAAATGGSLEEKDDKKGHGKGKDHHGGKGGKKVCDKGAKGKANKENGGKGQANKGKGQGKGKN